MPVVVLLSLPFLYLLARRPVLRRLAVRNAVRRPREAALVLLGSMLGTAIITGSLIVGDTLKSSISQAEHTQLGPVDEVVLGTGVGAAAQIEQALAARPSNDVDGVLPIVEVGAAVATGTGDDLRAEPTTNVYEMDFARAAAFGGDQKATGISGPTPSANEAVIGKDLAEQLGVQPGAAVRVYAYGRSAAFRVARIVPRLGVAGLLPRDAANNPFTGGSRSMNLFVAPGTIGRLAAGATSGGAPPTAIVAISNRGGVHDGVDLTERVTAHLRDALQGLPANVEPTKRDVLDDAETSGRQFTQLFGGIGFFSVLAGVLLLVNIFVMLAQERKTELGMLRAMGLRRAGLVGSFSAEGWLYALASSVLGAVAGTGVGRLIVAVASGIFSSGTDVHALDLRYHASGASIVNGFAFGFAISLVTVTATSLSISRLNVIRAIRDLPEPDGSGRRTLTLILGAVATAAGALMTAIGVAGSSAIPVLVGPALLGFGLVPLLRNFVSRRPLVSVVSAAVVTWAAEAFVIVPKAFADVTIPVFVVQGIVLVAASVALVTQNQDLIGAAVRRIGGGSKNMSLRLGLAYPLARRFRTGMILTMYALVVFTLTFITVFSHLFQQQVEDFTAKVSGGFDVRVDSNPANPVPLDAARARPEVEATAAISTTLAQFDVKGVTDGFKPWPAATFDATYVDRGPVALTRRPPEYPTDEAAYRALLSRPDIVIPSEFFLQSGGGPPRRAVRVGDTIAIRDPRSGRTRELRVAAIAEAGFANLYAYVSPDAMHAVFGNALTPNLLFMKLKPGADPERFAASLNGAHLANGADARSFRSLVEENLAQQQQFFRLMRGYLALGLVVGIAGLGVVMVRAVRERRRQVGVLRSLGFSAVAVRRAFVAESAFVALEGILIGVSLAILTAWRLTGSDAFGASLHFSVPWSALSILVLGTFLASLLATAAPAQQASHIRPAVALRIAD